jgi:hypothetical protein
VPRLRNQPESKAEIQYGHFCETLRRQPDCRSDAWRDGIYPAERQSDNGIVREGGKPSGRGGETDVLRRVHEQTGQSGRVSSAERAELDQVLEIELRQVQKRVLDSTIRPFFFRITSEGREFLLEGTDQRYGVATSAGAFFSVGFKYSPTISTISRTFSTKNGSLVSLKCFCRCGCKLNACQMRCTVDFAQTSLPAICRMLQCILSFGFVFGVLRTNELRYALVADRLWARSLAWSWVSGAAVGAALPAVYPEPFG